MIQEANLIWRYQDTDSGLVMPWYTLPTLQWLKQQDTSKWIVFEYGAGYSTIWWRLNCQGVISIEHNPIWAKAMNAESIQDPVEYINAIDFHTTPVGMLFNSNFQCEKSEYNLPDCIVIDGEHRKECLLVSVDKIPVGGYIIIDNWGQEDFPDTEFAEKLLEGWEKQLFKQPNHTSWVTAVFKKL